MKPHEKATELIEKFGCNAIEIVENTIDLWIKKSKYPKIHGEEICLRTLKYWNKVKIDINERLKTKI